MHAYSNGLHTSSKGITIEGVRVTGLNVAAGPTALCTIAEDCKAGLVSSVTHTAAGTYVFQLSIPYPPKVVNITAHLTAAAVNSPIHTARYLENSYNPSTGQFTIYTTDATPAAVNPATATVEMHVEMKFNRYTR
jgi:hypothetical protein